jgi:hypothetical protein
LIIARQQPLLNNTLSTMKTFQIVTLFALIAASMAFAPNAPKGEYFLAWFATKKMVLNSLSLKLLYDG